MLALSTSAQAKTITVAVIDTGVDTSVPKLCKSGHKNFVNSKKSLGDEHGHGTHVAGLIVKYAENSDFCIVSLTFYSDKIEPSESLENLSKAIQYAIDIKVDFINISGGGAEYSVLEAALIKRALNRGIKVIVAAGNSGSDLDTKCDFFPACSDSRLVVVGNLQDVDTLTPHKKSNYGKLVNRWEVGTNVKSLAPGGNVAVMSGTSQAAGIATGKLVRDKYLKIHSYTITNLALHKK